MSSGEKTNQMGLQILVSLCKYDRLHVAALTFFREERWSRTESWWEVVVLRIRKVLEKSYCTVYFDNFFDSSLLISKLFKKDIYGVWTAQNNRRRMSVLPSDKKIRRGDLDYQFSTDTGYCKWMNNRYVVMLFSNDEEM